MKETYWQKVTSWRATYEFHGVVIGVEVKMHSERDDYESSLPPRIWSTYLYFRDQRRAFQIDAPIERNPMVDWLWGKTKCYDGPLSGLPWNGGITYYKETTNADGIRNIQIGDDYAHAWDDGKHDLYTLAYMQQAVEELAKAAYELAVKENILPKKEN